MKYFILNQASRLLFPALLILSLIVLYRGHNLPGGGFIGGLLAATAFILVGLGDSMERAKELLRIEPVKLMALGLLVAVVSGMPSLLRGAPFMTSEWLPGFALPLIGKVHLGTPLVFDVGVYMVVIGFALHTTFSLSELAYTEIEEHEE
ncbi:MnhB domain-containing protein [Coraliomargarita sp. SDUM461003]|uniref:MnhB domain-containing protein n=1 Tax=Thalassobacterium maritimum TaxID=3041265 RepID=A0ABU1B035_9BACT|nr:MnhB domain-containing protein [Coraliomargarita sp. SDUM461003]MBT64026.1 Na(+)/H(+) antiporter subunit B [Puniceicoccaceae bacterium]MDQ8208854.1 MnhB domain-containing protein [Coraliomargarita sp. SDUM461003]HBR94452.1 Na(+)/H(+) antiporter subunit B [Opitutae bacterium]|tara:strand:+ start:6359 stop:6805 length:447 start_codon:yes stop_codon:yes gene_type:complete